MNLVEIQRNAVARGDNMADMIIQNFLEADDFFSRAQFVEFGGSMSYGWNEEKTLPSAGTRSANADYTENNGETEQRQEALKIYGGKIGIDEAIARQYGPEVAMRKQEAQIKAIRGKILNDFINGSSATNVEQFDGLKSQLPTTNGTTAGFREDRGFIVKNASSAAALSRKQLDNLIANVDTDGTTVLIMDKQVPYFINQYGESLVTFDKNEFGAPVARYGDIPIITFDRNNLNTKILGFTEASSTSSLFCVNLDVDKVAMLQGAGGLYSNDPEKSGSKRIYQIDWLLSLAVQGQYNAGRLYNFTAATMTA